MSRATDTATKTKKRRRISITISATRLCEQWVITSQCLSAMRHHSSMGTKRVPDGLVLVLDVTRRELKVEYSGSQT